MTNVHEHFERLLDALQEQLSNIPPENQSIEIIKQQLEIIGEIERLKHLLNGAI